MGQSPARNDARPAGLKVFHTGEHACGYWPERHARDLVLDPRDERLPQLYPLALGWGFRRSGDIVYRPHCRGCQACVAVRIPVASFRADRSQRRYLRARHAGGGMDDHGTFEFDQFLVGAWSQGRFLELREHGTHRLLAVAVTDLVGDDALSAVYTFFEPDASARGLGTLAILKQLEWAARDGRQHLYLGYWIAGHGKMDYKRRFQPLEAFDGRGWSPL